MNTEVEAKPENTNNEEVNKAENNNNNSGSCKLEPEQFRKVFAGGLNYKSTEEALRKHFSQCGEIVDCVVMHDNTGRSRGFGFVTFSKSEMVDTLMKSRPHVIDGREVDVKRATPKEDAGKPELQLSAKKLFVGAIREGLTEDNLREYFGNYGNITDCVIMRDNESKIRGFGFVEFDDYDPVDKIVLEKHHIVNGQTLDVKKALPKQSAFMRGRMPGGGMGSGGRRPGYRGYGYDDEDNFGSFSDDYGSSGYGRFGAFGSGYAGMNGGGPMRSGRFSYSSAPYGGYSSFGGRGRGRRR